MRGNVFHKLGLWLALLLPAASESDAAEIKVFSDGPLEPALVRIGEAFGREHGHDVKHVFGLSPVIRKRLLDGEVADVVIIQPDIIDDLALAGKLVAGGHFVVANVGIGLFTRAEAAIIPDISTSEALTTALLRADTLAFSKVASGNYFATVLDRLGIADTIKDKIVRASPAEVTTRIVQGKGNDIGVGTTTLTLADRRLRLIGPLPGDLQNYLIYVVAMIKNGPSADAAGEFIKYLGSPAARAAFVAAGAK
jgi:molybdate transport system substrate-binding protein